MNLPVPSITWVSWNIFLALIPVVLAYSVYYLAKLKNKGLAVKGSIAVLLLAWIAFIPNSCYLLTQWRHFIAGIGYTHLFARWHLDSQSAFLLMYYTLFYMIYSGIGILTFALAIRPIARMVGRKIENLWAVGIPFFLMMSVGVYLGLILRFNSWDLVTRPSQVVRASLDISTHPSLSYFILIFAGFLWLVYLAADIWIDGLSKRWKKWAEKST